LFIKLAQKIGILEIVHEDQIVKEQTARAANISMNDITGE
jgi:hypothetical protein